MTATYPHPAVPAAHQAEATLKVIAEVLAERARQSEIGHTPERDDVYVDRELARAAGAYALNAAGQSSGSLFYPWPARDWTADEHRRDLIRSAALAVAEVERLDRAEAASAGSVTP